jgi:hypothetical protein
VKGGEPSERLQSFVRVELSEPVQKLNLFLGTSRNMPSDKFLARSFGVLLGLGIAGIFIVRRALSLAGKKDSGAFIYYFELLPPPQPAPPSAPHPLSGLTFAVKDM